MKLLLPLAILLALNKKTVAASQGATSIFQDDEEPSLLHRTLRGWGHGHGHGNGGTQGGGGGGGGGGQQKRQGNGNNNRQNMAIIHKLLDHNEEIDRDLKYEIDDDGTPTIVSATTMSSNPQVADWIKKHVEQMKALAESGGRIRKWDPLFEAIFENQENLELKYEGFENLDESGEFKSGGVQAWLTGDGACAEALAQAHYKAVSAFVANGYDEMDEFHEVDSDAC